ncbi:MAG: Uma2 family endonuclease, partial [Pirellulales bacterium]|nr:Uma2 family endonuclease [Pirellulales bacterium]
MATVFTAQDLPTITVPDSASTLAGFRDWVASDDCPERGRFAFIDNQVMIDMSPERIESHVLVKQEIAYTVDSLNRELDLGKFYTDGVLITNEQAAVSNEPDGTFVLWESFESGRVQHGKPVAHECELLGSPDLVVEVVSPSSVRKDTKLLRTAYYDADIREYWLVDARGDDIDFQILVRSDAGFVAVEPQNDMTASQVLPASM